MRRSLALERWIPPLLFIFFFFLYQSTLSRVFTYDGLCYALDVEFGPAANRFHPNHLLNVPLSWVIFHLAKGIGYEGRALHLMQAVNASVAVLALMVFYRTLQRHIGLAQALFGTLFLGFSHTFWFQVTDPGCYAWAALATCLLLALLLQTNALPSFWVGAGHAVAVLFHQMLILVVPAFLVRFWVPKRALSRAAAYFLGGGLVLGMVYGTVGWLYHYGSLSDVLFWASHPGDAVRGGEINYWWNFNLRHNVAAFWTGFAESLVASVPVSKPLWHALAQGVGLGLTGALGVLVIRRGILAPLAAWVLSMSIFQFFYASGAPSYRVLFLPVLIYAAVSAARKPLHRGWFYGGAGLLAAMAVINFRFSIGPRLVPGPEAQRVEWIKKQLRGTDFLVFSGAGADSVVNVFMAYFASEIPARSLKGYFFARPDGDLRELTDRLRNVEHRQGRIFVEQSLWSLSTQQILESRNHVPEGTIGRWLRSWRKRESLTGPEGYRLVAVQSRERPAQH